jgi:acyl carrier protein
MASEELSPATRFDNLKMDSLDALNMIFALEEEFDIDIPNEEAAKMKSIHRRWKTRPSGQPSLY